MLLDTDEACDAFLKTPLQDLKSIQLPEFESMGYLVDYVAKYKFRYNTFIANLCQCAVELDNPYYLTFLARILGAESLQYVAPNDPRYVDDFLYFTNANYVIVRAVKFDSINILEWFYVNKFPFGDLTALKTAAASYGNLDVLKFLHELVGKALDTHALEVATYFYMLRKDEKYLRCAEYISECMKQ
jgi:hypothetical protein